jgi:hypothetical protein
LGKYGDISLNEMVTNLRDLKWDFILGPILCLWPPPLFRGKRGGRRETEITINAIPLGVNLISYSFRLRSYKKQVYNRPYPLNISAAEREIQLAARNRQLAIFAIVGAPLAIMFLRRTAIQLKDMISINYSLGSSSDKVTKNNSGLLLLLSNLNKKTPNWIKIFFILLFISIIVIKLLGIGIIEFINNMYYLKIFSYFSCSLAIIFQLINLYLLHKFSNKNIKISEVLPDFIIKWMKEFEVLSSSKVTIIEFKKDCYIHLCIYIVLVIIVTFIS